MNVLTDKTLKDFTVRKLIIIKVKWFLTMFLNINYTMI